MTLRYRTDPIPFEQFAAETGYDALNPDIEDDNQLRKELRDHYLNFNTREIAAATGENYSTVKSQFGSAIDQYNRTLAERTRPEAGGSSQVNSIPTRRLTAIPDEDVPDSFAQDLLDATLRGFTTGGSSTIAGIGILSNTIARTFNEQSEFGLDLTDFGNQLTEDFQQYFDIEPDNEGFLTQVAEGIGQFGSLLIGGGVGSGAVRLGARAARSNAPRIVQTLGASTGVLTAGAAQQSSQLLDRYIQENPDPNGYDQATVNGLVLGAVGLGLVETIVPGRIIGNPTVTNAVLNRIVTSRPLGALGRATETAALEGATEALQSILEDVVAAANIQDQELEDAIDTALDNVSAGTTGQAGAVGAGTGFGIGLLSALLPGRAIGRVDRPSVQDVQDSETSTAVPASTPPALPINPITQQPEAPVASEVVSIQSTAAPDPDNAADPINAFTFNGRTFTVVEDTLSDDGLSGQVTLTTIDDNGLNREVRINPELPNAIGFINQYVAQRNEQRESVIPEPAEVFDYRSDPEVTAPVIAPAIQTSDNNAEATPPAGSEQVRDNLRTLVSEVRNVTPATRRDRLVRAISRNLTSGGDIKDSQRKSRFIANTYNVETQGVLRAAELYDAGLRESDVELREPIFAFKQAINTNYGRRGLSAQDSADIRDAFQGNAQALGRLRTETQEQIINLRSEVNNRSAQIAVELESVRDRMENRLDAHLQRFPQDLNNAASVASSMQSSITQLTNQLNAINANLPSDESPLGSYVHRTYSIYFDKADQREAFDISSDRYQRALRFIAGQHLQANSNLTEAEAVARGQSDLEVLRRQIESSPEEIGFSRDRQILNSVSALRRRQSVPAPIREFLGEVTDPGIAFAATIHQQRVILSSVEMANQLESLGTRQGWLTSQPDTRNGAVVPFRSSSNNPGLAMMNGYYAPEWIIDGLNDHFEIPNVNDTIRMVNFALSSVKLGKTVFSVSTGVRNILSGVWSVGVNGSAFNRQGIKNSFEIFANNLRNRSGGEYHAELVRLGVVGDGVSIGTIRDLVKDVGHVDRVGLLSDDVRIDRVGLNGAGRNVRQFSEFMKRWYSGSDDLPKVIGYEQNRDLLAQAYGLDRDNPRVKEEAAVRVRDTYFTYSKVPKIIKKARNIPFAPPFISFPAEVYRTSLNFFRYVRQDLQSGNAVLQASAGKRLISAAATVGITYNLGELLGSLALGDDDEDIRRKDLMRQLAQFGKFTEGDDIQVTRVLDDGRFETVNMSRYNPYAGVTDTIGAFLRSDADFEEKLFKAVYTAASPFWQPDVTLSALNDAQQAYEREPGTDIDKSLAYIREVAKGITPTSLNEGRRVFKALNGELLNIDESQIETKRAVARAFGASTEVMNPLVLMQFRGNAIADQVNLASRSTNFSITGRNQSELSQAALNNQLKIIERDWGRALQGVDIMRQLGYDDRIIRRSVVAGKKGSGGKLSKQLTDALMQGKPYPGLQLSDTTIENKERRTRFFRGEEAAVEATRQALEKRRRLEDR